MQSETLFLLTFEGITVARLESRKICLRGFMFVTPNKCVSNAHH